MNQNFIDELIKLNEQANIALHQDDDSVDEFTEKIETLIANHLNQDIHNLTIEYPNPTTIIVTQDDTQQVTTYTL